jgi:hemoglobin
MSKSCTNPLIFALAATLTFFTPAPAADGEQTAPPAGEQLTTLEGMCAASADVRSARHADEPLFERLGGEAKIHELTREIVRLHAENAAIQHFVDHVDHKVLAERVAQFVISGTGGPEVYAGPSLTDSHAHLELSNAHFLAAGGDVIQAMKNLGHAQDEIDEMVCILVSLRHLVVRPEDVELPKAE